MVGASVPGWLAPAQTFRVSAATLDAAVSAGAVTTGTLTTTITLAGAILATATTTGALTRGITIAGAALATATMAGALTVTLPGRGPMLRSFTISQTPVRASWPRTHVSTGASRHGLGTAPRVSHRTTPIRPQQTAELVTVDG